MSRRSKAAKRLAKVAATQPLTTTTTPMTPPMSPITASIDASPVSDISGSASVATIEIDEPTTPMLIAAPTSTVIVTQSSSFAHVATVTGLLRSALDLIPVYVQLVFACFCYGLVLLYVVYPAMPIIIDYVGRRAETWPSYADMYHALSKLLAYILDVVLEPGQVLIHHITHQRHLKRLAIVIMARAPAVSAAAATASCYATGYDCHKSLFTRIDPITGNTIPARSLWEKLSAPDITVDDYVNALAHHTTVAVGLYNELSLASHAGHTAKIAPLHYLASYINDEDTKANINEVAKWSDNMVDAFDRIEISSRRSLEDMAFKYTETAEKPPLEFTKETYDALSGQLHIINNDIDHLHTTGSDLLAGINNYQLIAESLRDKVHADSAAETFIGALKHNPTWRGVWDVISRKRKGETMPHLDYILRRIDTAEESATKIVTAHVEIMAHQEKALGLVHDIDTMRLNHLAYESPKAPVDNSTTGISLLMTYLRVTTIYGRNKVMLDPAVSEHLPIDGAENK